MGGFLCTYINGVYPLTVPDGANLLLSVNLSGLYSISICFGLLYLKIVNRCFVIGVVRFRYRTIFNF